jgi:hypothetical protein
LHDASPQVPDDGGEAMDEDEGVDQGQRSTNRDIGDADLERHVVLSIAHAYTHVYTHVCTHVYTHVCTLVYALQRRK